MKLDLKIKKKVLVESTAVSITESPSGRITAQKKQNIYAVDPAKLAEEAFPKVNAKFCSEKGLNDLFVVLEQHVTNKMHAGNKDGKKVGGAGFSEIFELIFRETQKKDVVSLLSEEAIRLFFDSATQRFTKKAEDSTKAVELSHDDMVKIKKEKAMSQSLDGILGGGGLL